MTITIMGKVSFVGLAVLSAVLLVARPPAITAHPQPAIALQVTATQSVSETTQINAARLTSPDQCAVPRFWQFQPGQQTLRQFKQLALGIFTEAGAPYNNATALVTGLFDRGVALDASAPAAATLDTVVDYVYLRLDPTAAQAAGIDFSRISPTALIRKFGNPDNAFLVFNPTHPRAYRLILLYSSWNVLYIIRNTFQNGQACLSLTGVTDLSLYRFANATAAAKFISVTAGTSGLPPSIAQTTHQTVNDFMQMAQEPDSKCLTLL